MPSALLRESWGSKLEMEVLGPSDVQAPDTSEMPREVTSLSGADASGVGSSSVVVRPLHFTCAGALILGRHDVTETWSQHEMHPDLQADAQIISVSRCCSLVILAGLHAHAWLAWWCAEHINRQDMGPSK